MFDFNEIYFSFKILFYAILLCGIFLFSKDFLSLQTEKLKMRHRLKSRRKMLSKKGSLECHITDLLSVTVKRKIKAKSFIVLVIIIFSIVFAISYHSMSLIGAGLCATFMASLPYLLLRVKLESRRRKGSFEGEQLVGEFLSQYAVSKYNIFETIEKIADQGRGMKISRELLYKLILEIRSTGSPEDIKRATEKFSYGLDTNWSRMMANNIRTAAEKGINISSSLEDILIQLREARVYVEERKRLNAESARMVIFLIPALYLGTVLMSVRYLGLPAISFIKNQFYTAQGLILFIVSFMLFGLNVILLELVSHQRFDF